MRNVGRIIAVILAVVLLHTLVIGVRAGIDYMHGWRELRVTTVDGQSKFYAGEPGSGEAVSQENDNLNGVGVNDDSVETDEIPAAGDGVSENIGSDGSSAYTGTPSDAEVKPTDVEPVEVTGSGVSSGDPALPEEGEGGTGENTAGVEIPGENTENGSGEGITETDVTPTETPATPTETPTVFVFYYRVLNESTGEPLRFGDALHLTQDSVYEVRMLAPPVEGCRYVCTRIDGNEALQVMATANGLEYTTTNETEQYEIANDPVLRFYYAEEAAAGDKASGSAGTADGGSSDAAEVGSGDAETGAEGSAAVDVSGGAVAAGEGEVDASAADTETAADDSTPQAAKKSRRLTGASSSSDNLSSADASGGEDEEKTNSGSSGRVSAEDAEGEDDADAAAEGKTEEDEKKEEVTPELTVTKWGRVREVTDDSESSGESDAEQNTGRMIIDYTVCVTATGDHDNVRVHDRASLSGGTDDTTMTFGSVEVSVEGGGSKDSDSAGIGSEDGVGESGNTGSGSGNEEGGNTGRGSGNEEGAATGNSTTPSVISSSSGFDYTLPSLADGATATFTYSVTVEDYVPETDELEESAATNAEPSSTATDSLTTAAEPADTASEPATIAAGPVEATETATLTYTIPTVRNTVTAKSDRTEDAVSASATAPQRMMMRSLSVPMRGPLPGSGETVTIRVTSESKYDNFNVATDYTITLEASIDGGSTWKKASDYVSAVTNADYTIVSDNVSYIQPWGAIPMTGDMGDGAGSDLSYRVTGQAPEHFKQFIVCTSSAGSIDYYIVNIPTKEMTINVDWSNAQRGTEPLRLRGYFGTLTAGTYANNKMGNISNASLKNSIQEWFSSFESLEITHGVSYVTLEVPTCYFYSERYGLMSMKDDPLRFEEVPIAVQGVTFEPYKTDNNTYYRGEFSDSDKLTATVTDIVISAKIGAGPSKNNYTVANDGQILSYTSGSATGAFTVYFKSIVEVTGLSPYRVYYLKPVIYQLDNNSLISLKSLSNEYIPFNATTSYTYDFVFNSGATCYANRYYIAGAEIYPSYNSGATYQAADPAVSESVMYTGNPLTTVDVSVQWEGIAQGERPETVTLRMMTREKGSTSEWKNLSGTYLAAPGFINPAGLTNANENSADVTLWEYAWQNVVTKGDLTNGNTNIVELEYDIEVTGMQDGSGTALSLNDYTITKNQTNDTTFAFTISSKTFVVPAIDSTTASATYNGNTVTASSSQPVEISAMDYLTNKSKFKVSDKIELSGLDNTKSYTYSNILYRIIGDGNIYEVTGSGSSINAPLNNWNAPISEVDGSSKTINSEGTISSDNPLLLRSAYVFYTTLFENDGTLVTSYYHKETDDSAEMIRIGAPQTVKVKVSKTFEGDLESARPDEIVLGVKMRVKNNGQNYDYYWKQLKDLPQYKNTISVPYVYYDTTLFTQEEIELLDAAAALSLKPENAESGNENVWSKVIELPSLWHDGTPIEYSFGEEHVYYYKKAGETDEYDAEEEKQDLLYYSYDFTSDQNSANASDPSAQIEIKGTNTWKGQTKIDYTTAKAGYSTAYANFAASVPALTAETGVDISDEISFMNLYPNTEYKVTGSLMKLKADGSVETTPVKQVEYTFTSSRMSTINRRIITMNFGNVKLEPEATYVIFEEAEVVGKNGYRVEHKNASDKRQMIYVMPRPVITSVTKVWKDENGVIIEEPPVNEVRVQLYIKYESDSDEKYVLVSSPEGIAIESAFGSLTFFGQVYPPQFDDSVTLKPGNNWTDSWTELPTIDINGEELSYTVREVRSATDGWSEDYTSVVTGNMKDGFIITNTKKAGATAAGSKLIFKAVWPTGDSGKDTVKVKLSDVSATTGTTTLQSLIENAPGNGITVDDKEVLKKTIASEGVQITGTGGEDWKKEYEISDALAQILLGNKYPLEVTERPSDYKPATVAGPEGKAPGSTRAVEPVEVVYTITFEKEQSSGAGSSSSGASTSSSTGGSSSSGASTSSSSGRSASSGASASSSSGGSASSGRSSSSGASTSSATGGSASSGRSASSGGGGSSTGSGADPGAPVTPPGDGGASDNSGEGRTPVPEPEAVPSPKAEPSPQADPAPQPDAAPGAEAGNDNGSAGDSAPGSGEDNDRGQADTGDAQAVATPKVPVIAKELQATPREERLDSVRESIASRFAMTDDVPVAKRVIFFLFAGIVAVGCIVLAVEAAGRGRGEKRKG